MTDKEMIKRCAEKMDIKSWDDYHATYRSQWPMIHSEENERGYQPYDPLTNDAQAMALVKKMELWIQPPRQGHMSSPPKDTWFVAHGVFGGGDNRHENLNRAIVTCVANLGDAR